MTSYMHLSQHESMGPDGGNGLNEKKDSDNQRYPYCIVWTPIPLLTWLVSTSGTSNVLSRFPTLVMYSPHVLLGLNLASFSSSHS